MDKLIKRCINNGYILSDRLKKIDFFERHLIFADIKEWLWNKYSICLLTCPKIDMRVDRNNKKAVLCSMKGWVINAFFIDSYKEYQGLNEWSKTIYGSELEALEAGINEALKMI